MDNLMNLPWTSTVFTMGNETWAEIVDANGRCVWEGLKPKLAAHIVKCVNSHDRLVDALTVARNRLADMLMNGGDDGQAWKEARKAMPEIEAALAKAQGDGK